MLLKMIVINISKNRTHYFCESLISQCQYAYLFELFLILCAFFFVRNKSGGRRARSLSEKRAGFCTGSFTAEAPGLRTIVVMEKDESKIDVFSWFEGNFFFIGLSTATCWETSGYQPFVSIFFLVFCLSCSLLFYLIRIFHTKWEPFFHN